MKTYKKIMSGLGVLIFAFVAIAALGNNKASAAPVSNSDFTNAQYNITSLENGRPKIIIVTIAGQQFTFTDSNTNDDYINLKTSGDDRFICAQNTRTTGITLDGTTQPLPGGGVSYPGFITINYRDDTTKLCQGNADNFLNQGSIAALYGVPGTPSSGGGTGSTSSSDGNACEASNNTGFEWLLCGVLRGLGDFMDKVNGLIESQLDFNVHQNLNDNVHQAWGVFRTVASALLVIIMLIMVFSQAVSIGTLDAYTVRKLLPRLVAAVIFIQISWVASIWIIEVANDLGHGIADLLAAPFGGTDQLSLSKLIGQIGLAAPGISVIGGLLAVTAAVLINPFGAVMLAFIVFLGIITATVVLLIRQALIIACVIFLPIAFVAWILPGTQRYWKILWDNFIKALLLFPLILAVITIGRIFAWIVGTKGGSTGILDLFAIVIGFFGPYFLFPRMFRWGGNIMSAATNAISTGVEKMGGDRGKKFIQSRSEGFKNERIRQSQERYKNEEGFNIRRPWRRPIDLLRSGQWDPTRFGGSGRIRETAMIGYTAAGAESEQKDIDAANRATQLAIERIHPDEQDAYARALAAGQKVKIDSNGRLQVARFKTNEQGHFVDMAGNAIDTRNLDHIDQNGNLMDINGRSIANISNLQRDDETGSMLVDRNSGRIAGAAGATGASLLETRAGLDQITRLGGEANIDYIQKAFERSMNSGDTAQIEMMNKFTTANVQSLFAKLPHMYKNNNYAVEGHPEQHDVVRTVQGLNPNDITALSGVGIRTLRNNLMIRASDMTLPQAERDKSITGLRRLTSVFQQAATDPTLRGRIPSEVAKAMQELATGGAGIVDEDWGIRDVLNDISNRVDDQGVIREVPPQPAAPVIGGEGQVRPPTTSGGGTGWSAPPEYPPEPIPPSESPPNNPPQGPQQQ